MSYSINDRLSKMIFIELKDQRILEKISPEIYRYLQDKEVLFPVDLKNVKNIHSISKAELSVDKFFLGMLLCIGGNETFIYNNYYEEIILSFNQSESFFKGYIYRLVQEGEIFDAYILLKGLSKVYANPEYKEKLISVLFDLKDKHEQFKQFLSDEIEDAILNYKNIYNVYMYKSIIEKEEGNYLMALASIDKYIENNKGKLDDEVVMYRQQLMSFKSYEDGKEKVYLEPKKALELLIPLTQKFSEDALLFYYISIAYRKLGLYNEAIIYLNKSREIDTDIVETVNELGLNYASLGLYDKAVNYFLKVFEVTKSIESCTNIVMCYIQMKDNDNTQKYFELAKRINRDDEILIDIEKLIMKTR